MSFILDQERFIEDLESLIVEVKKTSEEDSVNLNFHLYMIIRYYNQATDWDINPDLARMNYHHPKEDLLLTVLYKLMSVRYYARLYVDFDPSKYIFEVDSNQNSYKKAK